jgi:hypothetical protein
MARLDRDLRRMTLLLRRTAVAQRGRRRGIERQLRARQG